MRELIDHLNSASLLEQIDGAIALQQMIADRLTIFSTEEPSLAVDRARAFLNRSITELGMYRCVVAGRREKRARKEEEQRFNPWIESEVCHNDE